MKSNIVSSVKFVRISRVLSPRASIQRHSKFASVFASSQSFSTISQVKPGKINVNDEKLNCPTFQMLQKRGFGSQEKLEYPHPLYFTPVNGRMAVTFTKPKKMTNDVIVGWINDGTQEIKPETFEENPDFMAKVHQVISDNVHLDPQLASFCKYAAMTSGMAGHAHVADQRNPPMEGRIPWPHDIIGTFKYAADGKIEPGTYSRNEVHRPVTGDTGLFSLDSFLHEALVKSIE